MFEKYRKHCFIKFNQFEGIKIMETFNYISQSINKQQFNNPIQRPKFKVLPLHERNAKHIVEQNNTQHTKLT